MKELKSSHSMTKETWEVIKKEFVQREEEDKYQDYKWKDHIELLERYAMTNEEYRNALFMITDSLYNICTSSAEYNTLYWKYLKDKESVISERSIVKPIKLMQTESEKCFYTLFLKFQESEITIEFHSDLNFISRENTSNLYSNNSTSFDRSYALQSFFNEKMSVLILPIKQFKANKEVEEEKTNHHNTKSSIDLGDDQNIFNIQSTLQRINKFDPLFGSYEEQLNGINEHVEKSKSIMRNGDFFTTTHSNLYYNMVIHCIFDNPFKFDDEEEENKFYSNLIFYLNHYKTETLSFCMFNLQSNELIDRINQVFRYVRQTILYDGQTSFKKIIFICMDTDLNVSQLKAKFDNKFMN